MGKWESSRSQEHVVNRNLINKPCSNPVQEGILEQILLNRITEDSKIRHGSGSVRICALIQRNSSSCTWDMISNRVCWSGTGRILIWRMQSLVGLGKLMMSSQSDGSTRYAGKHFIINSRGVPIIFYKSIISVIFNRNFKILNVKSTYEKLLIEHKISQIRTKLPPMFGLNETSLQ